MVIDNTEQAQAMPRDHDDVQLFFPVNAVHLWPRLGD